eukprot:gnl/TRDRNA2_/TRDRNA2_172999_c0_seq1.p1 gnl/TRDRNA2_/TRDRNA2_172999_c0~~gnl/TRDRNA2_/TRDRNA2_172999_c0_seq1.p1  ORF type:complete len:109 (+),score=13.95 gnl/TRDRNA2_/TRDRNA2_172999_c0_seq1:2-328(+)
MNDVMSKQIEHLADEDQGLLKMMDTISKQVEHLAEESRLFRNVTPAFQSCSIDAIELDTSRQINHHVQGRSIELDTANLAVNDREAPAPVNALNSEDQRPGREMAMRS